MYKKNVALLVLAALLICPGLAAAFGLGEIDIKSAAVAGRAAQSAGAEKTP